jgi:hypothetical protein
MFAGSYRLAKRPIQQLASDLFGLDISLGIIPKLERQAADILEPVVAEVAAAIVAARSAHIDETSWSEANEKAWLWVGQTGNLTTFTIADNRGADVARSIVASDPRQPAGWLRGVEIRSAGRQLGDASGGRLRRRSRGTWRGSRSRPRPQGRSCQPTRRPRRSGLPPPSGGPPCRTS